MTWPSTGKAQTRGGGRLLGCDVPILVVSSAVTLTVGLP